MKFRFFKTLAFRLTLMYAGIFSLSSCAAFILFYYLISQTILDRIDQDLLEKAGVFETVLSVQGMTGVQNLAVLEARAAGEKKIFFRLLYPNGEVFATSHMSYWQAAGVNEEPIRKLIRNRQPVFETITMGSGGLRARILYVYAGPGVILQTGLSMETYANFFVAFKTVFAGAMAIVVFMSALSGWLISKRALSGVGKVIDTAGRITGTSLEARVPETGSRDELDQLAKTFNTMLDRIETLVTSIREMTDNIAHDLKSPITRIRGLAEITLVQGGSAEDYEFMASSAIEESDRLLDMINTMLFISRAEAGGRVSVRETIDLAELVTQACVLFQPVAEDKDILLVCNTQGPLLASVDNKMIQRAVSNVLDNALKYTGPGGRVDVSVLLNRQGRIEIQIADTGCGISPEEIPKIFNRFYRVNPSRSDKGTGLGLSLARSVFREHGGDIAVSSTPGIGSTFLLSLPNGNLPVI